ncbi:MAG: geranylgeranylglyceryl/heptaprenylglyceryl phosphate synthase [Crocinitomicaceae bacterium]
MNLVDEFLNTGKKKLAILVDPDKKQSPEEFEQFAKKVNAVKPDFIFVGGSTVSAEDFNQCFDLLKNSISDIPLIIFPGGHHQINEKADGILFLSLLSGRNPDFLIGHQVQSAHLLRKMDIETIPTAYLLIDGGKVSSVSYVSQTTPIPNDQDTIAVNTAIAGEMMGFKAIFLDAGSGALTSVPCPMISAVKKNITVPLIIGGGIRSIQAIENCYEAGADIVVIGNKIEEDADFLLDLKNYFSQIRNPLHQKIRIKE